MNNKLFVLSAAILGITACTWIETTEEGREVLLVKAANVVSCTKLGSTTSSVKHEVGFVSRGTEKVKEELITLARNKAAEMGGDSIVAKGEPSEGKMSFDIYKCAD